MPKKPATVLLVESNADLRDLNRLVLAEDGYKVDVLPPNADLVNYVEKTRPGRYRRRDGGRTQARLASA